MSKPKRIQRKRTKGWRMSEQSNREVVYVGRPTKWGNPVYVSYEADKVDRQVAVEMYKNKLVRGELPFSIEDVRRELAGKDLACWCRRYWPCHADVLLEIANDE
jgi:hypothetical protein